MNAEHYSMNRNPKFTGTNTYIRTTSKMNTVCYEKTYVRMTKHK